MLTWWSTVFLVYQWTSIVFPPLSEVNPTWSGCTFKWHHVIALLRARQDTSVEERQVIGLKCIPDEYLRWSEREREELPLDCLLAREIIGHVAYVLEVSIMKLFEAFLSFPYTEKQQHCCKWVAGWCNCWLPLLHTFRSRLLHLCSPLESITET